MNKSDSTAGLAALLAPVRVEDFLRDIWERKPVHISHELLGRYDELLSTADIEELVYGRVHAHGSLSVFRGAEELPPSAWSAADIGKQSDALRRALSDGYSIYCHFPERVLPRLREQLDALALAGQVRALSHLVIAPANAQGFLPHTDPYGVFVLQIAGRKVWKLYGLGALQAGQGMNHHHLADAKPHTCHELGPGDLLYLPRGMIHATHSLDAGSIHLSVALMPPRGVDVLRLILELAEHDEFFQAYVPFGMGASPDRQALWAERFRAEVTSLIARTDPYELLAQRIARGSGAGK